MSTHDKTKPSRVILIHKLVTFLIMNHWKEVHGTLHNKGNWSAKINYVVEVMLSSLRLVSWHSNNWPHVTEMSPFHSTTTSPTPFPQAYPLKSVHYLPSQKEKIMLGILRHVHFKVLTKIAQFCIWITLNEKKKILKGRRGTQGLFRNSHFRQPWMQFLAKGYA